MLLAILLAVILGQGMIYYSDYRSRKAIGEYMEYLDNSITSFIVPKSDGELSPLVQTIDYMTDSIAHKTGTVVQASIRGTQSASAKAITKELEGLAVEENPLLTALPKNLQKNPLAMMGLQALLNNQRSISSKNNGGNRSSSAVKFNL